MIQKNMRLAFQRLIPCLLGGSKELLWLYVFLYPVSLYLNIQMEGVSIPSPDMESQRIVVMLSSAFFDYFGQILRVMVTVHCVSRLLYPQKYENISFLQLITNNFLQLLIERLRCVLAIAWRTVLLIVPGLREYVRLLLVDQVVLLAKDYEQGKVDALEESRKRTAGQLWPLFFAWMAFLALLIFNSLLSVNLVPTGVVQHFMVYTGGFLIELLLAIFMTSYYLSLIQEEEILIKG